MVNKRAGGARHDTAGRRPAWPAIVISPVLRLIKAITGPLGRPVERTPLEVADILRAFLEGTGGPWDWDDFISVRIADQRLDAIRQRCAGLPEEFPPDLPRHYCSAQGDEVIRQYVAQLQDAA